MEKKKNLSKNIILFFIGAMVLLAGITLVLLWWEDVVLIFRGVVGIVLALVGLFMLYLVKD